PEARCYFSQLDLDTQAKILVNSLQVVVAHAVHRYPAAISYLQILGNRHHRRGVPPGLYPQFQGAMLTTLAEFHGASWTEELADEWRDALDGASEVMLTGYQADYLGY